MVISNMFKWLKEARKQGEQHRDAEVTRSEEQGAYLFLCPQSVESAAHVSLTGWFV